MQLTTACVSNDGAFPPEPTQLYSALLGSALLNFTIDVDNQWTQFKNDTELFSSNNNNNSTNSLSAKTKWPQIKLFLQEGVILVILLSLNKQFQGELVVFVRSCDLVVADTWHSMSSVRRLLHHSTVSRSMHNNQFDSVVLL